MLTWAIPGGLFPKESGGPQPPAIATPVLFNAGKIRMWLMRWGMRKGRSGRVPRLLSGWTEQNITAKFCWWNLPRSRSACHHVSGGPGIPSDPYVGGPLLCEVQKSFAQTLLLQFARLKCIEVAYDPVSLRCGDRPRWQWQSNWQLSYLLWGCGCWLPWVCYYAVVLCSLVFLL